MFTKTNAHAQTGDFYWAAGIGSSKGSEIDEAMDLAVDADDNVYVTGNFSAPAGETVDFDPGPDVYNLTSNGGYTALMDVFISKFDTNGALLWAKSIGGTSDDFARNISLDSSGNIYVTGTFHATVDFDPGPDVFNLTSNNTFDPYITDIFILKLDNEGNFLWAKAIGGVYRQMAYDIAFDSEDDLYLTGFFNDTVDFDPGPNVFNLTSNGGATSEGSDIFILKLDNSGNFVWAKSMGGPGWDEGIRIIVDGSGNFYISGDFEETFDFDPGPGTTNITSNGYEDAFLCKFDSSGNLVWVQSFGGMNVDWASGLGLDSLGNVYTTGVFGDTVDFDPGSATFNLTSNGGENPYGDNYPWEHDIFVSKFDNSGNFIWAKSFGGTSEDFVQNLELDSTDNLYLTGAFGDVVDFDPGLGTYPLSSNGNNGDGIVGDIFISKLDSDGNFIWAKSIGGAGSDYVFGLALGDQSDIYMTGSFEDTVDFDPGKGTYNLTSKGYLDIFISKLLNGPDPYPWSIFMPTILNISPLQN